MGDNTEQPADKAWDDAWHWLTLQHEQGQLSASAQQALTHWLAAAPEHRTAYADASQLWLITGLVPPANPITTPGELPDQD